MIWLERDDMIIHTHNNYHSCTIRILVYLALYYVYYGHKTETQKQQKNGCCNVYLVLILTCDDER